MTKRKTPFYYSEAFGRNLGLVTEAEQDRIRNARVALPGLGGVGGSHLEALARLGVGRFNLADLDVFELGNIHRQLGADTDTLGRPKVDVLAKRALAINPGIQMRTFSRGIHPDNIEDFLKDVDVVVDGIDFYCIEVRRMLYAECRRRHIPVVHAGPIGYGSALLVFLPDGPSFDTYFGMEDGMTRAELLTAHLLGHSRGWSVPLDPSRLDIENRRGPALGSACMLCGSLAAMEVLKLVCRRGRVAAAPHGVYHDPFRQRLIRLRPQPSLRRSLRGRVLRWTVFRRLPELRELHERELAQRERRGGPKRDGDKRLSAGGRIPTKREKEASHARTACSKP